MPDISHTLIAKSNQLNAADLAQPITVTIERVDVSNDPKQPVTVHIRGGDYKPWKPCKVIRRILAKAWGTETDDWIGRRATIYNEPSVVYGGTAQGGIRIKALSHIRAAFDAPARESQRVVKVYPIARLPDQAPQRNDISGDEARAKFIAAAQDRYGLTVEMVDVWLVEECNASPVAEQSPDALRAIFGDLGKCKTWYDAQQVGDDQDGE